jgi:oligopeptide transport system substrate-binding protein
MLKLLVPFVLLIAAIGITVATDDPAKPADFTFINRGDVTTLDLQRMSWMQDLRVGRALFEGLVRNDIFKPDYDIQPGVAEKWEISGDGKTYTFHLRADAKWSNGDTVKASDFVYSWRRALLPDTVSDYTALFQMIEGGREFFEWRNKALETFRPTSPDAAKKLWERTLEEFDKTVKMKAVDARTFTFTLVRPTPYYLDLCAFAVFYPVYPPLVKEYESPNPDTGRIDIRSGWTKAGTMVSNGPFELTRWRFKRDLRLERNKFYWNQKRIALDSISIVSIEDPNSQVLAFRSGQVDWVSDVSPPYRADILAQKYEFYKEHQSEVDAMRAQGLDPVEIDAKLPPDPRNRVHIFPAFGTYFYNFNCLPKLPDGRANPFADKRVRRAFALTVDKNRIVDQVRRVGEHTTATLIPPNSIAGYASPKGLGYDVTEARRLLTEAGFPGGKGLPVIEILYTKDGGHEFIAQSIKKDWEENLGVSVSLAQREIKVFRNDLKKQNYMVSRAGWFGDYGDPTTFLDLNRKDDGNNDRKYNSLVFDALMQKADNEGDAAKRLAILSEAEKLVVEEDVPLLPLFQYTQMYFFDPHKLTGISSHPRQEQSAHEIDMLGDGKGTDALKRLPAHPMGVKGGTLPQKREDAKEDNDTPTQRSQRNAENSEKDKPEATKGQTSLLDHDQRCFSAGYSACLSFASLRLCGKDLLSGAAA